MAPDPRLRSRRFSLFRSRSRRHVPAMCPGLPVGCRGSDCPRRSGCCPACALATSTHVRGQDLDLAADRWSTVAVFPHLSGSDGTETEQSALVRSLERREAKGSNPRHLTTSATSRRCRESAGRDEVCGGAAAPGNVGGDGVDPPGLGHACRRDALPGATSGPAAGARAAGLGAGGSPTPARP
jgi:hypothetical protein